MSERKQEIASIGETNDITVYEKINNPIEATQKLGVMFARSGLFGCTKEEQGQILALACISERKSPFELMRTYHLFNGKLEMKSSAMLARFKDMGGKCIWKSDLMDREKAQAEFSFEENEGIIATYTIEDARAEGLAGAGKDNWEKSTPDMLRARLIAKTIRMIAPQVNSGIYDAAEMTDGGSVPSEDRKLLVRAKNDETIEERKDDSTDGIPDLTPQNGGPPIAAEVIDVTPTPSDTEDTEEDENLSGDRLKVAQIIEGNEDLATSFMLDKGIISQGKSWRDASDEWMKKITERPESFLAAIKK